MPDVFVSDDQQPIQEKQSVSQQENLVPTGQPLPFLAAYCHMPKGIQIPNQNPNEEIVLFLRQHFIKNSSWISFGSILLVLPLLLFLPTGIFTFIRSIIPVNFIIIFVSFYYLIVIGYIYVNFITWFYNVGVVTTQQLIDVDFTDVMYRNIAKTTVKNIIDVSFTQGGFLDGFFDFGDVVVQTEGEKENFEFKAIPHPDKVTDILLDLKEKAG